MSDPIKSPAQRMNVVDRVVSFFAPDAGARRMAARVAIHEFGYDAAYPGSKRGTSGGMYRNANTENYINNRDRIKLIWDARDLVANDWIGGTLSRIVLYTVGDLTVKSNTGDPQIDQLYDDYFYDWCGDEEDDQGFSRCDVTGRHRFLKIIQLALLGMFVDGDHGIIFTRDEETNEIKLQQIEADRIGSPLEAQVKEDYIGGITLGSNGKPQSYRVFSRTRYGMYVNPQEIPPENFIHLTDPFRSDQYRGITILKALLADARDIKEWVAAEKAAGKIQSLYAALITSKDPLSRTGASAWDGKTTAGTPSQQADWGKILKLAEGENVSFATPGNRPSGAFMAFVQMIVRKMAVSMDLPYGFVWDLSALGGVTARIEVQQAQRRICGWQRMLVDKVIRRVRKVVLADGIAQGLIPSHPGWTKFDAHFGPWITTDAGYETTSDIALVKMGLKSASDVTAAQARDVLDVARRNAATVKGFQDIAAQTGIPVEMFAPDWLPNATSMLASMATPPPQPGTLEAVGEKGAKEIIDLLSKVTTGEMDKDAAIQSLVTIYGMPPAKAKAIVPEPAPQPKADDTGAKANEPKD
jgi:capsid protein